MASVLMIESAEKDLRLAKEAYVRRFGWTETCNTPGSYWLWKRDFADVDAANLAWWEKVGGRRGGPSRPVPIGIITADLDMAVSMTRRELDRDEPEEGEDDGEE